MITQPRFSRSKGFALVVTLSLMILLTIVAVGLLTLSSVSLRAAGQGEAMAVARNNARLALMLAIGDLQKSLGPDKAVTAQSDILSETVPKRNLTGVWDSWNFDVNSSNLDYDSPKKLAKSGNNPGFKGWLVSDRRLEDVADASYPNSDFKGESIELVGDVSLGKMAISSDKVRAGRIPVMRTGKQTGNFAWHVAEEAVKARINTYRDASQNQTLAQQRSLLAGHRPDASVMTNSKNTKLDFLPRACPRFHDFPNDFQKLFS